MKAQEGVGENTRTVVVNLLPRTEKSEAKKWRRRTLCGIGRSRSVGPDVKAIVFKLRTHTRRIVQHAIERKRQALSLPSERKYSYFTEGACNT